jgi:serine protease Do
VTVDDLDFRTRRQFNIPNHVQGALVVEVSPGCPAAEAGLEPGDVIQEINRKRVTSADDAVRLSREATGSRVLLRVYSRMGSRYVVIETAKKK